MSTKLAPTKIKIWKKIKLGVELEAVRKLFGDEAPSSTLKGLISIIASEPSEVDLVMLSVKSCSFESSAEHDKGSGSYTEICAYAKKYGFEKCQAEVGPQLRLQYPDQPLHEVILIGMDPIFDRGGSPGIFGVEHDYKGSHVLNVYTGHPDHFWHPVYNFVFVAPR